MDFDVEEFGNWHRELTNRCPGYCGRLNESDSISLESCQACLWGWRSDTKSNCVKCGIPLRAYDYCFLVFNALVSLIVNGIFLKLYADYSIGVKNLAVKRLWIISQILCVLLESSLAVVFALLLIPPRGRFILFGCPKSMSLKEWYPMLFDPVIDYTRTLKCSQELVYPLYTLPFLIYAFALALVIVLRGSLFTLARFVFDARLHTAPFYATLWALPLAAFAHAVMAGLIYYAFPYLCIMISLALAAAHAAVAAAKSIANINGAALRGRRHRQRAIDGAQTALTAVTGALAACAPLERVLLAFAHATLLAFGATSLALSSSLRGDTASQHVFALALTVLATPPCFYALAKRIMEARRTARYHIGKP